MLAQKVLSIGLAEDRERLVIVAALFQISTFVTIGV